MTGFRGWPRSHRGLAVTVVTGLLAASGAICIGVAVNQRQDSSRPPQSGLGLPGAPAPDTASASPGQGSPKPAAAIVGPVLPASVPVALTIPAIGVKAPVQRLGQTADGSLEVPAAGPKYDYPGWYRYSPTPGSLGPSVIVGHVDSAANGPSVFWRLGSLRPRDTVRVTRADGSVAVFSVDDVRRFRKTRFPSQLVYGDTNHAALRLITCGGPLEGGHYRDNVVVRASLIREAA
jgi:sortase (surface protein transpeptidase)